jgi:3-methylcrotonyl-CoA carboxylase alpha subunit/geranyl-CoA carboxylase alpha subunit
MRLVTDMAQLLPAVHSARSEALAGFGNGNLLMERALLRPRHIEVQIMADAHGHCIHLGERDCSVQRRHQKIIEESPSPAVNPALREQLGQAAIALAQSAGYVGAGTVEFLLDEAQANKPFYLMEMNTRLQVEHPVTELLTGLDLVEWQLRIARGEPLPLAQADVRLQGHGIEVRLCAEDEHFTPQTGTVQAFAEPQGLRFDHALHAGAVVTPHYDSMLGKLVAHAPTRSEAIDKLCAGLNQTTVLGLPTNRAFLTACLAHPVFRAGEALIPFLAEQADAVRERLQAQGDARTVAVLAVLYTQQSPAATMPSPFMRPVRMDLGDEVLSLSLKELGQGQVRIEIEDATHEAHIQSSGDLLQIALNGKHWQARALACNGALNRWHVQLQGPECLELWLNDQSHSAPSTGASAQAAQSLRAPFNGKLIALHVQEGQSVKQGDPVLVIESMKLEHVLNAPRDAVVHSVTVTPGQQVGPGQALVQWKDAA